MADTQRAAVLVSAGAIEVQSRPVPLPGPTDVLVEVLAVGVCGSDVHYFTHGRIADFVVERPLVLGHEASGRIVAVGTDVRTRTIGERVAIEPGIPCGHCDQCRAGRYNLCPFVRFLATPPIDGAFTQYLIVPEYFAHPVPDSLSDAAAALIEPLAVGVWANARVDTGPGVSVLITGAGPVGLLAAQVARARGVTELTITDVTPERLGAARAQGFEPQDARVPLATAFDVLIECSGALPAIRSGLDALAPAGRAVLVGLPAEPDIVLPANVFQRREVTMTGSFRYANVYPAAIALAAAGRVDLEAFASRTFRLDEAAEALRAPGQDPSIIKAVVLPQA